MNGIWDEGEEAVERAGFTINGSGRQGVRTDGNGEAVLVRLQPRMYADVALDLGTLDDAQWQPAEPGGRVLQRPGKVQRVDFPVVLTVEIDGIVFLADERGRRGIGNARLQLVNTAGNVVGETRTSSDGFYIVPNVRPGRYQLRIEREQLTGIGLVSDRVAEIEMTSRGEFVYEVDFVLRKPSP